MAGTGTFKPSTNAHFRQQLKESGQWYEDDLIKNPIAADVIKLVPKNIVERFLVVPVDVEETVDQKMKVVLVTNSERAFKSVEKIIEELDMQVRLLQTHEGNFLAACEHYYGISANKLGLDKSNLLNKSEDEFSSEVTPIVSRADSMITAAINRKASDIHMLPTSNGCQVEFRINGHLINVSKEFRFPVNEQDEVVNIIKNKCDPKMDSSNIKKDDSGGKIKFKHNNEVIDIRVATVPATYGQKLNMRLLTGARGNLDLEKLGYLDRDVLAIRIALMATSGLFLATGPTGSGKTTTLYAEIYDVLKQRGEPLNIMTIEDPIEYQDETFCQVQVHEAKDKELSLTARDILKVGLRLDPDIFLFGEIRDKDDAEVTIEAATTGHKVFSTVHARDCISAISRLLDLDVSKSSLLREIKIIVSQRLVGVVCPHCSVEYKIKKEDCLILTDEEIQYLNEGKPRRRRTKAETQVQCRHCKDGHSGRTAVAEYVVFDTDLRDFLLDAVKFASIQSKLENRGFRSMWAKGLDLVREGVVDLDEVVTVIGKE